MPTWTKREINAMTSAIRGFVTYKRMYVDLSTPEAKAWFLSAIEASRLEIIRANLRGIIERAETSTKGHQWSINRAYDGTRPFNRLTQELLDKWHGFLTTEQKTIAWTNKLLARLESEPLPFEVLTFDPLT
jgi:hypothetical protein